MRARWFMRSRDLSRGTARLSSGTGSSGTVAASGVGLASHAVGEGVSLASSSRRARCASVGVSLLSRWIGLTSAIT